MNIFILELFVRFGHSGIPQFLRLLTLLFSSPSLCFGLLPSLNTVDLLMFFFFFFFFHFLIFNLLLIKF